MFFECGGVRYHWTWSGSAFHAEDPA